MRMLRFLSGLAVAAAGFVVLPAVAQAAAPAHTGLGIRLLDAPRALVNDPRARSYIIDALHPGTTITRHVEVSNDTGHSVHVLLYVVAADIQGGQFVPGSRGATNELTSWSHLTPSVADLAQGQSVRATVTVTVPRDATGGERYGAIIADLPPSPGTGIRVENRVGIRMYLDVTGATAPKTDFTIDTLTAERDQAGNPVVQAQVHNIGGRAVDLSGTLTLDRGPGGLSAGPFEANLGTTLAPGQSEPVTVKLDKALPAGPWHARIELRSGLLRHAAEGTLTFPAKPGTSAAPVTAKPVPLTRNRHVLVPVAIGLILALLIGLGLFLWWRRRRRREEDDTTGRSAPSRVGVR